MTELQRDALDFIAAFITRMSFSPSIDEIREHLGLASKSSAHRLVGCLLDRGYLRREGVAGSSRSLVPVRVGAARFDGVPTSELRAELARRGEPVGC